jgi:TrmH family RNA methyltransferase
MRLTITSVQNPRVKSAAALHGRRERREEGLMLVEGFHEISLAWEAGMRLRTLFVCEDLLKQEEWPLLKKMEAADVETIGVSQPVMAKIAYRENPDAWIGVAEIPNTTLDSLKLPANAFVVVVEGVEKPGNLGAILRSADAVGADAVLFCDGRTDAWNPNVVRASKGSLFSVPVVEVSSKDALSWLRQNNIEVFAATPAATDLHWRPSYQGAVAIAVGAEKEGLTEQWMTLPHRTIKLPMHGKVNSLNVAQAFTAIAYEVVRQRSFVPA